MKNTIKTVLASLAALAMLSTTPVQTSAYNMNEPKIIVQSQKRDMHVNFSKDGKKFVYTRLEDKGGFEAVSEIVLNENGIEKVLTQGYTDIKPSFSPDGKKVAFFRSLGVGYGYIYTIGVDGKNLEEIIPSYITNITWSPDGKEIAFTCDYTEEKTHMLTEEDIEVIKKQKGTGDIAYKIGDEVKYEESYTAIGILNLKTKDFKYLTKNEGRCENPEFTDDGKILYLLNKNKGTSVGKELWVMGKNGDNKKPLVQLENYTQRITNKDGSVTFHLKEGSVDKVSSDGDMMVYLSETRERIVQYTPKKNKFNYDTKEIKDEYISSIYVRNLKTGETKLVTDEGNIWFPELKNNKVYFSRCESEETDHDIYSIDLK
jgi:Tol biopolymer transport system component